VNLQLICLKILILIFIYNLLHPWKCEHQEPSLTLKPQKSRSLDFLLKIFLAKYSSRLLIKLVDLEINGLGKLTPKFQLSLTYKAIYEVHHLLSSKTIRKVSPDFLASHSERVGFREFQHLTSLPWLLCLIQEEFPLVSAEPSFVLYT